MNPILSGQRAAQRPPLGDLWRHLVAHLLRSISAALARRAREVARPLHARHRRPPHDVSLEFHADAGAPEGALYVDGDFVGYIDVHRL